MLTLLLLAPVALADEAPCIVRTREEFEALITDTEQCLERYDLACFEQRLGVLAEQVRCVREPVQTERWARLQFEIALVRFNQQLPWHGHVLAAWCSDSSLDPADFQLQVGHPVERYWRTEVLDRASECTTGPRMASQGDFLLDGRSIDRFPTPTGLHILQHIDGQQLESALLREGEALPEAWRWRQTLAAAAFFGAGGGLRRQAVVSSTWEQAPMLEAEGVLGGAALSTTGWWRPTPAGVGWDFAILAGNAWIGDLYVGPSAGVGPVSLLVGGGVGSGQVSQPSAEVETLWQPQAHVGIEAGGGRFQFGAGGGAGVSSHHAAGYLTLSAPAERLWLLRVRLQQNTTRLEQVTDVSSTQVNLSRFTATAQLGFGMVR